jgi:hypothetical protein
MTTSTLIQEWSVLSDSNQSGIIKIQFTCRDKAALQTLAAQMKAVEMQQDLFSKMTPTSRVFCLDRDRFGLVLESVKKHQFNELEGMLDRLSGICKNLQGEPDDKVDDFNPSAQQQEGKDNVQQFRLTTSMWQAKNNGNTTAYNPECFKFDDVPTGNLLSDVAVFLDDMKGHQEKIQNNKFSADVRISSFNACLMRATKQDDKQAADGCLRLLPIFKRLIACQMLKDNIVNQNLNEAMWISLKNEMKKDEVTSFTAMVSECNKGIRDELLNIYKDILYTAVEEIQKEKVNFTLETLLPQFSKECKDRESLFCTNLVKCFLKQSFDKGVSKQKVKKPDSKYAAFCLALDNATKYRVTPESPKSAALAQHGIHKKSTSPQPSDASSSNRQNITKRR